MISLHLLRILPGDGGDVLFNTFISATKIFEKPITKLEDLEIQFIIDNEGNEVDFQGKEHSFTLEVFQKVCAPNFTCMMILTVVVTPTRTLR